MGVGTYESKVKALESAGIRVARTPLEVVKIIREISGK
jgi:succinyl-CoA synthetase alpha subunit